MVTPNDPIISPIEVVERLEAEEFLRAELLAVPAPTEPTEKARAA